MSKPEFPKPSAGDELILLVPETWNRDEKIIPVRVRKMARYKVELEDLEGKDLPWYLREFDIRTRTPWGEKGRAAARLHTQETLAYKIREKKADTFLRKHGIMTYHFRGVLREKVDEDPVGFVNLLLRYCGENEI